MLTLRLQHGRPPGESHDWPLDDADQAIARRALAMLGDFAVEDPESRERVLLVREDGAVTAWNEEGARQFAAELNHANSPVLQEIRKVILHPDSAG